MVFLEEALTSREWAGFAQASMPGTVQLLGDSEEGECWAHGMRQGPTAGLN